MTQWSDFAWAVGILEGEGCFTLHRRKHKGKVYAYPTVRVKLCDYDVLAKLHSIIGGGSRIDGPYKLGSKPHYKPYWMFALCRKAEVIALLDRIYPHMGERRQQQIDDMMEAFRNQPRYKETLANEALESQPAEIV